MLYFNNAMCDTKNINGYCNKAKCNNVVRILTLDHNSAKLIFT